MRLVLDSEILDRLRGVGVGAAIGDALGMPLEFLPRRSESDLLTDMIPGRIAAGTFTDDTEMALALAESLLAFPQLNPIDLGQRFVIWMKGNPPDIGNHTRAVIRRLAAGESWNLAANSVQRANPSSAGNGSVMRCWPVALSWWDDLQTLIRESILQSQITHSHTDCTASCAFINATISLLVQGWTPPHAISQAMQSVDLSADLRTVISQAPEKTRDKLPNTGWVLHTIESAVWGLVTTNDFENALINVVNLGNDADTAGTVVGALAGAAYGIEAIPLRWRTIVKGHYPLGSNKVWSVDKIVKLVDKLVDAD